MKKTYLQISPKISLKTEIILVSSFLLEMLSSGREDSSSVKFFSKSNADFSSIPYYSFSEKIDHMYKNNTYNNFMVYKTNSEKSKLER